MDARGWDERYRLARAETGALWSAAPHARLQRIAADLVPGSALDVATGDGRNAIWLACQGWIVAAADFSNEALDLARVHAADNAAEVDWHLGDVRTWAPPHRYDLVTMTYLHLSEPENRDAVRRAASWVNAGGTLIVIGHDRENLARGTGGPQDPSILYTPELLSAGADDLDVLISDRIERDTRTDPEGPPEEGAIAIDTLLHARRPAAVVD